MRLINQLSGDSTITEAEFSAGKFSFKFEDGDSCKDYLITVPTQLLYWNGVPKSECAHIRVLDLRALLPIEPTSKIYVTPPEFVAIMKLARQHLTLAIGLKSTEWPYMLSFFGHGLSAACPIQSIESVTLQPIGEPSTQASSNNNSL